MDDTLISTMAHFGQIPWDYLAVLHPASGVLHVGAGLGHSIELYKKLQVPSVIYVEADKDRLHHISASIKGQSDWLALGDFLADKCVKGIFYLSNNPNESGLIKPANLAPFWQNLKLIERQRRQTTTINDILEKKVDKKKADAINWVHIDCLPALTILQGGEEFLDNWDIVIARVILREDMVSALQNASKAALDAFMLGHGFTCAVVEPERHPAIGQVLYVRDWKKQSRAECASLTGQIQQLSVRAKERAARIDELSNAQEEQQQLARQRESEIEALRKERDELAGKTQELEAQIRRITQERDQQQKAVKQLEAELAKARGDSEEWQHHLQELENTVRDLTEQCNAHSARAKERAAKIDKLDKALEEQQQLARQRESEIDALRKERDGLVAELKVLKLDVEIARKQVLQRDGDLENLRGKYAELKERHDATLDLLQQLRFNLHYMLQLDENDKGRKSSRTITSVAKSKKTSVKQGKDD